MSSGAAERAIGIRLQRIRMARLTIRGRRKYAQEAIVQAAAAAAMNRVPASFLGYSPGFNIAGCIPDLSDVGVLPTTPKTCGEMLTEVRERNDAPHKRVVATPASETTQHRFKDPDWILVDVASLWGDHKKSP